MQLVYVVKQVAQRSQRDRCRVG